MEDIHGRQAAAAVLSHLFNKGSIFFKLFLAHAEIGLVHTQEVPGHFSFLHAAVYRRSRCGGY
jgi:hypothetical protein